jgi:hypothetical protein
MKKHATILLLTILGITPALAAISNPHVAGDFQGWDAGANPMTETFPGSGIWQASFSGMTGNSRHEFKITDGTWNNSFPGPNSWLYSDGNGGVTITYDTNTYADGWSPTTERLGLSTDPGAWTAVGDFQSEVGGTDWTNNDPFTAMVDHGNGLYMYETTLPAGTWNWKAVVTGSWDSISWDNRSTNTANWAFDTDAVNNTVQFWVDSFAGTAKVVVIPEPASLLALGLLAGLLRRR